MEPLVTATSAGISEALAPQVMQIIVDTRGVFLRISGLIALFLAGSPDMTLRTALNGNYRITETKPYFQCRSLNTFPFL